MAVRDFRKNRRNSRRCMEVRRARDRERMIPALATVGFGGILCCHQVVGYGDDWKQYQEDYSQSDELHLPAFALSRSMAQPQPEHQRDQHHPDEIEN